MNAIMISAIIRHILTTIAGAVTTHGVVNGEEWESIAGGAAALAGVVWSLADKRKRSA